MEQKKRVVYLDLMRIFATFSMILLHVAASNFGKSPITSSEWQIFNIYESIVRFCVPVFIMISGSYFLDARNKVTLKGLFTKNILRIVTAFVFWSALYSAYSCSLRYSAVSVQAVKDFIGWFLLGNYHMWFLFCIVGLYLITPLLRRITADPGATKYFLLLFVVICLFGNAVLIVPQLSALAGGMLDKAAIHFVVGFSGYYVLGFYLNTTPMSGRKRAAIYLLAACALVFTILMTRRMSLVNGKAIESFFNNLLPNTAIAAAAVFLAFKYGVSKISFSERASGVIAGISKLCFGIYLVHDFFNILFVRIGFSTLSYNPVLSVPLNSVIIFVLSLLVIFILNRIPVIGKYIT